MDAANSFASPLLLLSASVLPSSALKLPSYIKPCSRDDPNLNDCAYKHALEAIPSILKGDPKYNAPPLNPLKVSQIKVRPSDGSVGLGITFNDVSLYGIDGTVVEETNIDLAKNEVLIKGRIPALKLLGKYEMDGQILLLPIKGNGVANISIVNLELDVTFRWELEKKDDGKDYIKPLKSEIKFDLSHANIHLDNLFGGNKLLGDNMNKFLNENSKDVAKEVGPGVAEALATVVTQIITGATKLVPYDEVFPPKV